MKEFFYALFLVTINHSFLSVEWRIMLKFHHIILSFFFFFPFQFSVYEFFSFLCVSFG